MALCLDCHRDQPRSVLALADRLGLSVDELRLERDTPRPTTAVRRLGRAKVRGSGGPLVCGMAGLAAALVRAWRAAGVGV